VLDLTQDASPIIKNPEIFTLFIEKIEFFVLGRDLQVAHFLNIEVNGNQTFFSKTQISKNIFPDLNQFDFRT